MSRLLLTHIVGAGDLEPEVAHMTLASNAWVVEYRGNSQWEVEAPDVHSLRFCLLPGWALYEAMDAGDEDESADEAEDAATPAAPAVMLDDAAIEALEEAIMAAALEEPLPPAETAGQASLF